MEFIHMKASHMSPSIAELRDLLYSLRIPIEHCESYVKELQILGYDSVLSFLRDVSINELTFVKHDHKQRIVSLLRSRRGINTLEFDNFKNGASLGLNVTNKLRKVSYLRARNDSKAFGTFHVGSLMSLSIPKISFKHQTDKVVKDVIEVHEGIKKPDFRQTLVFPVLVEHLTAPTRDSLIVIEKIGRGAKSVVYKCLFTPTLTLIAVKCLDPISNGKEQSARLISTEINALYNLSKHELKDTFEPEYDCDVCMGDSCEFCQDQLDNLRPPLVGRSKYIVKFYESYSDDEQGICLVMEYMQGESLKTLFDRGLVATEYNLAVVAYSVLQALKEVHAQKIIHRDVKLDNILVTRNGKVRLADFGIVVDMTEKLDAGPFALASTFTGTLGYMCPCRLRGKPYNSKCDIWALAICLLTLTMTDNNRNLISGVFGKDPTFWGMMEATSDNDMLQSIISLHFAKGYSDEYKRFISKSMHVDPNQRASVDDLLNDPFIKKCIPESVSSDKKQPRLEKMLKAVNRPLSLTNLQDFMNKLVHNILSLRPQQNAILRDSVDRLWPTWNRAHLAEALGVELSILDSLLQEALDRVWDKVYSDETGPPEELLPLYPYTPLMARFRERLMVDHKPRSELPGYPESREVTAKRQFGDSWTPHEDNSTTPCIYRSETTATTTSVNV